MMALKSYLLNHLGRRTKLLYALLRLALLSPREALSYFVPFILTLSVIDHDAVTTSVKELQLPACA
jgi:hypothetical protein